MNQPSSLNRFRILIFLGEYAEFGCSDIMITPSRYLFFLSFFFVLFLSLMLVICFGTHGEDNDGRWIREDNF